MTMFLSLDKILMDFPSWKYYYICKVQHFENLLFQFTQKTLKIRVTLRWLPHGFTITFWWYETVLVSPCQFFHITSSFSDSLFIYCKQYFIRNDLIGSYINLVENLCGQICFLENLSHRLPKVVSILLYCELFILLFNFLYSAFSPF